jgi:hypothetical protein
MPWKTLKAEGSLDGLRLKHLLDLRRPTPFGPCWLAPMTQTVLTPCWQTQGDTQQMPQQPGRPKT